MLSIVIVNWNVCDLLHDCLHSVEQQGVDLQVIVVDSASQDGSVEMVRSTFPTVELITCEENVGFTRGNNIGIEAAAGDLVMLLNPDTVVRPGALEALVRFLEEHPQAGVVGPRLLNEDGSLQPSRRRFPTRWTAIFESTWLEPLAPRAVLDHFFMNDQAEGTPHPVDWVQGTALVVRRAVIDAVGPMDEGFFMYSEELDWQKRIKEAGWAVWYTPEAEIVHYGGKSSEQVRAQRDIYFHTSKIRYHRKHHGAAFAAFLRLFLLGNYVVQLLLESAKAALGHKRAMRRERITAYQQVLRSGLRG